MQLTMLEIKNMIIQSIHNTLPEKDQDLLIDLCLYSTEVRKLWYHLHVLHNKEQGCEIAPSDMTQKIVDKLFNNDQMIVSAPEKVNILQTNAIKNQYK